MLILGSVLLLSLSLQTPAIAPPPTVSHREYLEALIRALSQAHEALSAVNAEKADDVMGRLTALKNAKIEMEMAGRTVAPFAKVTDNEDRATAGDSFVTAFAMMVKSLEGQISLYERLDMASSADDLKGFASAASEASDKTHVR